MRARAANHRAVGFRSPMTRAAENNAKGTHMETTTETPTTVLPLGSPGRRPARPVRRPDHHPRDDGSRRPLRPPDQALEPEDEAASSSARATASTSSTCSRRSAPFKRAYNFLVDDRRQRRLGAVRRHQEAGAGGHRARRPRAPASSTSPTAGWAARSPTSTPSRARSTACTPSRRCRPTAPSSA